MRLMMGITRPRRSIIGLVPAGEVVAAGRTTTRYKPGDQVCGLTGFGLGASAEHKCMRETDSTHGWLAPKPENQTYEESSAAACGGLLTLQYLAKGDSQPGQRVLVCGASGTSGTAAVQYAKHLGAEVAGVCSAANVGQVKSLGADAPEPRDTYDFVLDSVGKAKTSRPKESCRASVPARDRYVSITYPSTTATSCRSRPAWPR